MRDSIAEFIRRLTDISSELRTTSEDTTAYWSPDEPPETTALSDLGRKIVDDFDLTEPATNHALFHAIEEAMNSADTALATAVATGMLEGIIGRSRRTNTWDKIRPLLRNASARHADAWLSR